MRKIDRFLQYLDYNGITENKATIECKLSQGLLHQAKSGKSDLGYKTIDKILDKYQDIDRVWLLTGEGEMLKTSVLPPYSVSTQNVKGVPYYDVDFIGGFDLIFNDQTIHPAYYIDFPAYNKADSWANITGHSMEPLISHGDMVALKRIEDWTTYLLFGEVYGIITDKYRTVKKVRKSNLGNDYLRLVPVNPEYDEQDIPKSIIQGVFQILGCAKRIF